MLKCKIKDYYYFFFKFYITGQKSGHYMIDAQSCYELPSIAVLAAACPWPCTVIAPYSLVIKRSHHAVYAIRLRAGPNSLIYKLQRFPIWSKKMNTGLLRWAFDSLWLVSQWRTNQVDKPSTCGEPCNKNQITLVWSKLILLCVLCPAVQSLQGVIRSAHQSLDAKSGVDGLYSVWFSNTSLS